MEATTNTALVKRADFSAIEKNMQSAGFSPEKVKQEISFALQIINRSKQLQECSKESLCEAVMNISNIGLSLNPVAKEAYLVPRWNSVKKKNEASLDPGYVGLVKLLTDSGSVKSIVAQLVYTNDKFEIDLANNMNPVKHLPELNRSKRGDVVGVYALATLIDGTRQVEYMSIEEVYEIRDRSESYKAYIAKKISTCIWVSDSGEMSRKTVIKRIYKYLPRTERMTQIDEAIKYDNVDYSASDAQVQYIENLLNSSTLEERQKTGIEMELAVMSAQRASEVIEMLRGNQQLSDKEQHRRTTQSSKE